MRSVAAGAEPRPSGKALPADREPIIRLEGASLVYGGPQGVVALTDVSLRIDAGELVVVVGPSGCGKSSLLKLVSGLHPARSGSVVVAGDRKRTRLYSNHVRISCGRFCFKKKKKRHCAFHLPQERLVSC